MRGKRSCPTHNTVVVKTTGCSVDFVYLYPNDLNDQRRWFGGIIRNPKLPKCNFHNHEIHGPWRISQGLKKRNSVVITSNPALTSMDITYGKVLGFIPSAVDAACSHSGRVCHEVNRTKVLKKVIGVQ